MPDDKKLPTYPLDDAMKELLELFNQCNDKNPNEKQQSTNIDSEQDVSITSSDYKDNHLHLPKVTESSDNTTGTKENNSATPSNNSLNSSKFDGCETIEKLQQRQSELQNQLDEVLKISRELELKHKKKLSGLIQDSRLDQGESGDSEEDIELIEFHQIEIELRISELNRQLNNIQEELRIRLYKRLQSKTSGGFSCLSIDRKQPTSGKNDQHDASLRRNSTQTDESTPPSSSCSDETTTTSTIDMITNTGTKNAPDVTLKSLHTPTKEYMPSKFNQVDSVDGIEMNTNQKIDMTTPETDKETEKIDLELAFDRKHNYEVVSSTTSSQQQQTNSIPCRTPSRIPTRSNVYRNINNNIDPASHQLKADVSFGGIVSQIPSNGYRNCPTSNDLERIEEGEEDDIGYYCNSQKFRSIYEEKISPMIQAAETDGVRLGENQRQQGQITAFTANERTTKSAKTPARLKDEENFPFYATPKASQDNRFNISNINSAKRGNRPLTIYLPKPDEDIDLVETIQSLGHDLDILSTDLKITPTSAQGYLYKSCSNNSKKWLKRYFYFNRETKILSYYENEEQLVKKTNSPKCTISFDEISDVYVDHRLSEKQKSTTRNSYVFVLATIKRKYILASSRAETMRAWIDILFTAAKANDYFQQIENNEESLSFNYDSYKED